MTTVKQMLATITSPEELRGFVWALRNLEGAKPVTDEEWRLIAFKQIAFQREEDRRKA